MVVFTETFAVLDRGVGDVSELIEADVGSFLDTAIAYNFDVPPVGAERPRLFQLLNVDGNPALEVVAMRVSLDSD